METIGNVAVSNSEEEKKCLPVFDDYVIDTAEDSKIYLSIVKEICRRNLRRRKKKKLKNEKKVNVSSERNGKTNVDKRKGIRT